MQGTNTSITISAKDHASRVFRRVGMEAEGVTRRVHELGGAFSGLAALGGVATVGLSLTESVSRFGEYESALTDMAKVTNRDFGSIRSDIESLNPELGTSTQLMRGYYQTISAGVTDPVKSVEMLTVASKASQAAHVSQAETIKALTKVMAGYAGEIDSATEASDLLFAIEKQGQTSFQELVPVVGDISNISKQAAVSTNEMGGAMALLTQTSGSTSEAATKYKALLTNLIKPTSEMEKAFKALGYESGKALITDKGMLKSLQLLQDYADGAGIGMGKLFESSEALLGVSALLTGDGDKLAQVIAEVGRAAGSTDAAFDRWGKTLDASQTKFNNIVNNTLTTFGGALAPELNRSLDGLSDWIIEHNDDIKDWAVKSGEFVSSLSSEISREFGVLKSGYDAMPEWMRGAGLLGAFLFGRQGMFLLASATHLLGALSNTAEGFSAWQNGELDFSDFATMNAEELADFLSKRTEKGRLEARLKELKTRQASYVYAANGPSAYQDEIKDIESKLSFISSPTLDQVDAGILNRYTQRKAEKAAAEKAAAAENSKNKPGLSGDINPGGGNADPVDLSGARWLTEDHFAKQRVAANKDLSEGWAKRSGRDMASEDRQWDKYNAEKLRKQQEFNRAYAEEFLDPYLLEQKAIKEQARIYREDGNNRVRVDQWEKSQLAKLAAKNTADRERERKKAIENEKKAAREKLLASDGFFCGVEQGYKDLLENQQSWAERGADIFGDFATSASSALGDLGFDAVTGQMKSFSQYWESFWRGLARSMTDSIADLAVNKGLQYFVEFGGDALSTGWQILKNRFHTGNYRVAADEVQALLQQNEMVFPGRQSDALRDVMGGDGMSEGAFYDRVVDYATLGRQVSLADRVNNSQRDQFGGDMAHAAWTSIFSGFSNAAENWMTIDRQAAALRGSGLSISQSAVDNLKYNTALAGLAGTFSTTFAGDLFGSFGNRALGMNDNAFSVLGLDFSSANVGNLIGAGLGMFFGGPVSPVVSGVLSPVFSLAVSGVADAFDMRRNETLRDSLEDRFGFIGGRTAYQSFGSRYVEVPSLPGYYQEVFDLQSPEHRAMINSLAPVTYPEAVVLDKIELAMAEATAASKDAQGRSDHFFRNFGTSFSDRVWGSGTVQDKDYLANSILSDLEFSSYSNREKAARQLGKGFVYGDFYYTSSGERVSKDSVFNPDSPAAKALGLEWGATLELGDKIMGYQLGDFGELGDRGGNALGGYRSYTGVADYGLQGALDFGNRMQEFADTLGSDSDRDQGDPGGGSFSGYDGFGLRHGGRVTEGGQYVWQEWGLPGEIFMPQTDGFVINHEISQQFIGAVRKLVESSGSASAAALPGSGQPLVVNIVLDGETLARAVIPYLRDANDNGEQFYRADMLIED